MSLAHGLPGIGGKRRDSPASQQRRSIGVIEREAALKIRLEPRRAAHMPRAIRELRGQQVMDCLAMDGTAHRREPASRRAYSS